MIQLNQLKRQKQILKIQKDGQKKVWKEKKVVYLIFRLWKENKKQKYGINSTGMVERKTFFISKLKNFVVINKIIGLINQ